jgi:NAD(P)-dependent dehydrogenase (short-subunit alcohol dehydrogenase family)
VTGAIGRFSLQGMLALVTGVSSGLDTRIAQALVANGVHLTSSL